MRLDCQTVLQALDSRRVCEKTDAGLKVGTHCLYPSADQVFVFVSMLGDGFRVTDGGGISRSAFIHGRDEQALKIGLQEASDRHALRTEGGVLIADVPDIDWLPAAIAAVANGASLAAQIAIEHTTRRSERGLAAQIHENIAKVVEERYIAKEFEFRGKSGKSWRIDYAILRNPHRPILLKAVTPHHNSISANYTAFGDIGDSAPDRYCVFSKKLGQDDASLLRQVAILAPIGSLETGVRDAIQLLN